MTVESKRTAPDRQVRGTVHSYWLERRRIREASRKRQATRPKRQASSNKLDKPINLWDKAI